MATQILSDLDFNNVSRITNLPDPTSAQHAATKAYVDNAIEGLAWKDSCRVSTQSNINLASPGSSIDGISMSVNDRVLVRFQSTSSQNGIYIWNGAAVAMSRAVDANTAAELEQAVVTIEEGTDAGATFRQTAINFTLDTDNVIWTSFGNSAPSASTTTAGIAELATQGEVDAGVSTNTIVTPETLAAWSGRIRKYTAAFGDGSATQYDITHNFNTREVNVQIYRTGSPYDTIICDVERITTNAVRLKFSAAPTSNQFTVVVLG